jgi:DNA-binding transcriptional LysR family regulator
VVAAPAYLARHGRPETPEELLRHAVVVYGQGNRSTEWRFRAEDREISVRVSERLRLTAAEGVRAAVLAGLGLTLASDWMFSPELASGAVLPVLERYDTDPITLWAVLPGRRAPARTRAFLDFIQRRLPPSA